MTDNATFDPKTNLSNRLAQMRSMLDDLMASDCLATDSGSCAAKPAAASENTANRCCLTDGEGCKKLHAITTQMRETTSQAIGLVRRHPLETAAVAVGTGLLVWWLVSHRTPAA